VITKSFRVRPDAIRSNTKSIDRSVLGEHLLELPVLQEVTKIKIWANDLKEPDNVVVGVG